MSFEGNKRTSTERKRNILYLIEQYLIDAGLNRTAELLKNEANLESTSEVCDNVDLDSIYLEYCSYFHLKFGKYPRVLKKSEKMTDKQVSIHKRTVKKTDTSTNLATENLLNEENPISESLKIVQLSKAECNLPFVNSQINLDKRIQDCPKYSIPEWKELAQIIYRDIITKQLDLSWDQIYGNAMATSIVKEAILMPLERPDLFVGNLKPWKAFLLHGPPGTGKTLIAKTLCSETFGNVRFFNVCSSTIISKWRGESEKFLRVLFDVASFYAPSIIFIDEVEGLTSRRDNMFEHEASKRFKNEFLSLLDGINECDQRIFLLASTNLPWEIDPAFLRRFEKKILLDLPQIQDRKNMIQHFLPSAAHWTNKELDLLAEQFSGFTGDEIRIACKEATMKQLRKDWTVKTKTETYSTTVSAGGLRDACTVMRPISKNLMHKHIEWNNNYGNKF